MNHFERELQVRISSPYSPLSPASQDKIDVYDYYQKEPSVVYGEVVRPNLITYQTVPCSVDYGPRLVGVASSDPFGNVVPICTLPNDGDTVFLCSQILDVARSRGALEVIVGLPLDSNGKMSYKVKNFNGQLCLNFSMVLAATTTVALPRASVHLFDERYTTREAKARIKSEKIKGTIGHSELQRSVS